MGARLHVLCWLAAGCGSLVSGCILSPQRDPPGDNILASATDDLNEVAVIGGGGAVPPGTGVRVEDTSGEDDGSYADASATPAGSFVAVVAARPEDTLRVTYTIWEDGEWRESRPRDIVVDRYDPTFPPPLDADDVWSGSPYAPGERADGAGGFAGTLAVDPPVGGLARVYCLGDCTDPGVRVIVANENSGAIVESSYVMGVFEVHVPASVGDVLLAFAVRASDSSQASRVVRLIVPAP